MSDYKSVIKGTLSSITEKARDLAESGTVREVYDKGASRAKTLSRIAKLTLEYNGAGEDLKKAYMEIGRLYYEENCNAPQGFFAPLFEKIKEIGGRMDVMEKELDALKAELKDSGEDAGADFESVVSDDEDKGK
jgi:hypothetical protein